MNDSERLTYRGKVKNIAYCDFYIRDIINKLAEYEDAEEQGKLFVLPCKVGDKVYRPIPKLYRRISVMTVVKIVIQEDGVYFKTDKDGGLFKTSAIGKTFFITKEKAEAALEKMKGEEYE